MTAFFRAYDLRGVYPDDIDGSVAERVGKAYGSTVDGSTVAVGRDGRNQAPEIAEALIAGITATGTDVIDLGLIPTPVSRYAATRSEVSGAAMVTASHNPPEYIGVKFSTADGVPMPRVDGMDAIQRRYESGAFETGEGTVRQTSFDDAYLERLLSPLDSADVTVAVNFGHGAASVLAGKFFDRLGCRVIPINETIDGSFPSHPPVPDHPDAVAAVEARLDDADLGIAFDGDGDRLALVLPEVGAVGMDDLMAVFADVCLAHNGRVVVHSLDTSQAVEQVVHRHDAETVETPVGFLHVAAVIADRSDVAFGGEPSGHFGFPAFGVPWDDALFGAGLCCQLTARGELADAIAAVPDVPVSPTHRIPCPQACKEPVVDAVADVFSGYDQSRLDGVKIWFDDGWALVRPSNTEPKLSARVEAESDDAVDRIETELLAAIEQAIAACADE